MLVRLVPFAAVASAGALNVFLMRGEEIRKGIDVYPVLTEEEKARNKRGESLGKSKKAGVLAVGETALSRVLNATPIMVLPPLVLVKLQQMAWLKTRPRLVLPVNLGTVYLLFPPLILLTLLSLLSLPIPPPNGNNRSCFQIPTLFLR